MAKRLQVGDVIPAFRYDTPHQAQKSFYQLTQDDRPLVMVFLRNFGHPITRHFITNYLESIQHLEHLRLACVVQSRPEALQQSIPEGALPFELICDAECALYDYLQIPQSNSRMRSYSIEAVRIIRKAQKEGYQPDKKELHQLPLTVIVGRDGEVLFCHYGSTVTDLPPNCEAMEGLAAHLQLMVQPLQEEWQDSFETQFDQPEKELVTVAQQLDGGADVDQQTEWVEEQQSVQDIQPVEAFIQEPVQVQQEAEPAPQREEAAQPETEWEQPTAPQQPEAPVQPAAPRTFQLEHTQRPDNLPRGKVQYSGTHREMNLDFSALGLGFKKDKSGK